ncbi:carbohydrate-binding protein [Cysteiniphilum sp. 6C5]|uniref:carbohydrate-binding protein n=1 Tax=unclassified Cysteiniphilum TaxID=2610889 RepID=UPI003F831852
MKKKKICSAILTCVIGGALPFMAMAQANSSPSAKFSLPQGITAEESHSGNQWWINEKVIFKNTSQSPVTISSTPLYFGDSQNIGWVGVDLTHVTNAWKYHASESLVQQLNDNGRSISVYAVKPSADWSGKVSPIVLQPNDYITVNFGVSAPNKVYLPGVNPQPVVSNGTLNFSFDNSNIPADATYTINNKLTNAVVKSFSQSDLIKLGGKVSLPAGEYLVFAHTSQHGVLTLSSSDVVIKGNETVNDKITYTAPHVESSNVSFVLGVVKPQGALPLQLSITDQTSGKTQTLTIDWDNDTKGISLLDGHTYHFSINEQTINGQKYDFNFSSNDITLQSSQDNYQIKISADVTPIIKTQKVSVSVSGLVADDTTTLSFIKEGKTVATKETGNTSNLTLDLEPGQYTVQASSVIDGDYEYDAAQQTVTILDNNNTNSVKMDFIAKKVTPHDAAVKGWPSQYIGMGAITTNTMANVDRFKSREPFDAVYTYSDGGGLGKSGDVYDPEATKTTNLIKFAKAIDDATSKNKEYNMSIHPIVVTYTANFSGGLNSDLSSKDHIEARFENIYFIANKLQSAYTNDGLPGTIVVNPDFASVFQNCTYYNCQVNWGSASGVAGDVTKIDVKPALDAAINDLINKGVITKDGQVYQEYEKYSEKYLNTNPENDFALYVQTINWWIKTIAPNIPFGWSGNIYVNEDIKILPSVPLPQKYAYIGGGINWIHYADKDGSINNELINILAKREAEFLKLTNVYNVNNPYNPDFYALDKYGQDVIYQNSTTNNYTVGQGRLFNALDWQVYFSFVQGLHVDLANAPIMLFQLPGSHLSTKNDTTINDYASTATDYVFGSDTALSSSNLKAFENVPFTSYTQGLYRTKDNNTFSYLFDNISNEPPYNWTVSHIEDLQKNMGVFSILWGSLGPASVSIAYPTGGNEDNGWLADKIHAYYSQHGLKPVNLNNTLKLSWVNAPQVDSITKSSAHAAWGAKVAGQSEQVTYSYVLTDSNGNAIKSGAGTSASFANLSAGDAYTLKVTATADGCSALIKEVSFKTNANNNQSQETLNWSTSPNVSNITDSGATINWSAAASPNAETVSYSYVVKQGDTQIASGAGESANLSGLTANTQYTVIVTASAADCADISTQTQFTTSKATPSNLTNTWKANAVYTGGDIVIYNNHRYKANWWNQNDEPDINSGAGKVWTDLGVYYVSKIQASFLGSVPNADTVSIDVNGKSQSVSISGGDIPLAQGSYTLNVSPIIDTNNNAVYVASVSPSTVNVTADAKSSIPVSIVFSRSTLHYDDVSFSLSGLPEGATAKAIVSNGQYSENIALTSTSDVLSHVPAIGTYHVSFQGVRYNGNVYITNDAITIKDGAIVGNSAVSYQERQVKTLLAGYLPMDWNKSVSISGAAKIGYNTVIGSFLTIDSSGAKMPEFLAYEKYSGDGTDSPAKIKADIQSAKANDGLQYALVSVGGANNTFNPGNGDLKVLAQSTVDILNKYGFDGLDFDLEGINGFTGAQLSEFIQDLRALKPEIIITGAPQVNKVGDSLQYVNTGTEQVYNDAIAKGLFDYLFVQEYNTGGNYVDETGKLVTKSDANAADETTAEFIYNSFQQLKSITPSKTLIVPGEPATADSGGAGTIFHGVERDNAYADMASQYQRLLSDKHFGGAMTWEIDKDVTAGNPFVTAIKNVL